MLLGVGTGLTAPLGCSKPDVSSASVARARNGALDRKMSPDAPRQLWVRGGSAQDTMLRHPVALVADGQLVYVIDGATGRVYALDAATGADRWHTNGEDRSEAALARPSALAAVPGGGVAVYDDERRAVQLFDRQGRAGARVPLLRLAPVQSFCALADGSLLLAGVPGPTPLARVGRDGQVQEWLPLPWPDLAKAERIQTQAWLAGDGRNACALALAFGRGFAIYEGGHFGVVGEYVEWFDLPQVVTRQRDDAGTRTTTTQVRGGRLAARDVILHDTELWIPFQGTTDLAYRLIDVYDRGAGSYLRSVTMPERVTSASADASRIFAVGVREGWPTVTAFATR
jgi:hypothetical protein